MTTRRAFLAGAGALAVAPLLPAMPTAGKSRIGLVLADVETISKSIDASWLSGGSAIRSATYHVWMVRTANGAIDTLIMPATRKRAPNGFRCVARIGSITRETISEQESKS